MRKINKARLLAGGIAAGLVIDLFEALTHGVMFANRDAEMLTRMGISPFGSAGGVIALNLWGIAAGMLIVGLYTALRPAMGPGSHTAVRAGLYVWAGASVLSTAIPLILGMYKLDMAFTDVCIELVAFTLAALAGGAIYKESTAAKSAVAAA